MSTSLTAAIAQVRRAFAPDLLQEPYRSRAAAGGCDPATGHCYVAAEVLFHKLGGRAAGWSPMFVRHEGEPHWFLRHADGRIVDPTASQFRTPVPHHLGVRKGFLTVAPSKRAKEMARRAGLGGAGAPGSFAPAPGRPGYLLGWRVARFDPATSSAVSGADSRQRVKLVRGTVARLRPPGLFLGASRAYVVEHYAVHDVNVVQQYAFRPSDVTFGSIHDAEPEIAVREAVLLDFDVFEEE